MRMQILKIKLKNRSFFFQIAKINKVWKKVKKGSSKELSNKVYAIL